MTNRVERVIHRIHRRPIIEIMPHLWLRLLMLKLLNVLLHLLKVMHGLIITLYCPTSQIVIPSKPPLLCSHSIWQLLWLLQLLVNHVLGRRDLVTESVESRGWLANKTHVLIVVNSQATSLACILLGVLGEEVAPMNDTLLFTLPKLKSFTKDWEADIHGDQV